MLIYQPPQETETRKLYHLTVESAKYYTETWKVYAASEDDARRVWERDGRLVYQDQDEEESEIVGIEEVSQ